MGRITGVTSTGTTPGGIRRRGAFGSQPRGCYEASRDLDAYWDFHDTGVPARHHAQRYADGIGRPVSKPPPPPSPPRPSTGQVALAVPLAEAPWAVDEEEPHPKAMNSAGSHRPLSARPCNAPAKIPNLLGTDAPLPTFALEIDLKRSLSPGRPARRLTVLVNRPLLSR